MGVHRKIGRPKLRWSDVIQNDLEITFENDSSYWWFVHSFPCLDHHTAQFVGMLKLRQINQCQNSFCDIS